MSYVSKSGISYASYIHEMATELQILANNNNLHTLSYLLGQCVLEADSVVKSNSDLNDSEIINPKITETNQKQISPLGLP